MSRSAENIGFQYQSQVETLWHMRAVMNDVAYAAAGGNVCSLEYSLTDPVAIGDVVRHSEAGMCARGLGAVGQYTYGAVLDIDTEKRTALVKLLGEAIVRCASQAVPGYLALVREDGAVDCVPEAACREPQRIVGVVSTSDAAGRCRVVLGMGRQCAASSPLSAQFISEAPTENRAAFCAGLLSVPNMYLHGEFCTGLDSAEALIDGRIKVGFIPGMFAKPPLMYSTAYTEDRYLCRVETDTEAAYVSVYGADGKLVRARELSAVLGLIVIGEAA